jgi:dinuclear metal center YbgI/SA1388 family protein
LCLDVTEAVIREAIDKGCNLVVSHHPLLFRGLKQVADMNDVQRTVRLAIKNDVCVISMHTNMDNAQGGVNWKIAECMGLTGVRFFAGKTVDGIACGSGIVGTLEPALSAEAFVLMVKERFGVACAMCNQLLERAVRTVAVCGGAGDFLLDDAIREGADAFVTGEMHYHQYFGHEQEIQICVIGHYQSEQFTTEVFRDIIERECPGVPVVIAATVTNPIVYM